MNSEDLHLLVQALEAQDKRIRVLSDYVDELNTLVLGRQYTSYILNQGLASALSISAGMSLPGLRGFWPMTMWKKVNPWITDVSGHGLHLVGAGVQAHQYNSQIPCAHFGIGSGDNIYHADHIEFDIVGNEGEIVSGYRGLTMGCWFRPTNLDGSTQYIMGKWTAAGNQKSYNFRINTSNKLKATLSTNGSAEVSVTAADVLVEDSWTFCALQWSPSTRDDFLRVYTNMVPAENTTGIPATLHSGTARFDIGSQNGTGSYFDGQIALAFLCSQRLSGPALRRFYHQTKSFFDLG